MDVPAHSEQGSTQSVQHEPVNRPKPVGHSATADRASDVAPPPADGAGQIGRREFLLAGTAAAALLGGPSLKGLLGGSPAKTRTAAASPAVAGQWTAPLNLGLISIHAVVLHTGQLLLFSYPQNTVGSAATLWDPVSGSLTDVSLTYQRDIFCSGMTVLPDGRVFMAGGHIYQGIYGYGVANTTIFDPSSNSWTEGPLMSQPRWYPTTISLGDGTVMIFGGTTAPKTNAVTIDHYDPSSNTITTLPSTSNKSMATYPRMKLTTTGLLAWTNLGTTYYLNPATSAWTKGPKLNSAGRGINDSSVLLPGLTEIMEIGGHLSTGTTNTAEILDLSSSTPAWRYTAPMTYPRVWANNVLLADGTVLVVGGGGSGDYTNPVYTPELYDPVAATWAQMAPQVAPRMYHSTAALLPDGRVLSAGESHGKLDKTGEIFSPPYLSAGPQPTITSAPASLGYNQQFAISTPDYATITGVALVKAGCVTHSNNFDQRYVDVAFQSDGSSGLTATSPPDSNHAPPGWYMLFIVNSTGVPSVATWTQVG
jgi:galactose oxidase